MAEQFVMVAILFFIVYEDTTKIFVVSI